MVALIVNSDLVIFFLLSFFFSSQTNILKGIGEYKNRVFVCTFGVQTNTETPKKKKEETKEDRRKPKNQKGGNNKKERIDDVAFYSFSSFCVRQRF